MTAPWTQQGELLVVSYGGGVNSVGMLVGMHERGIIPDVVLNSDTGGEKPETYAYMPIINKWLAGVGFPPVTVVSVADNPNAVAKTLEEQCLRLNTLPSIAYGFKTCSQRWKADPQRKFINNWGKAKDGRKIWQAIGYDAGETHRALMPDKKTEFIFPLREWGWDRSDCIAAINRAGLPIPVKSACFFCPSSKKKEILALKREHPDLLDRAIAIERNAAGNNTSVKGLGRNWSWEQLVQIDDAQGKLFQDTVEIPCMCFDGEEDD